MGIVIELQREALSKDVDLLNLLRKAYLVARKLGLKKFEDWLSHEMNGYGEEDDIPKYRIYHGNVKAWNPYRGWIPIVFESPREQSILSEHRAKEPIANLVDVYNNSNGKAAMINLPDSINDIFAESVYFPTKYALFIPINFLFSTFESIRNMILDWSITLEETGIVGEGLVFSDEEIKTAKESKVINNYITNIYGNADNTNIQQGTSSSKQG